MAVATQRESVIDHIMDVIPSSMFDYIDKHQRGVYEEVNQSISDARYSPVEGNYLAGYLRRSLMESLFRKAAEHAGLKAIDVQHPRGRFSCVHIFADNLQITTHRVLKPSDFVRPCASRQQDASVNKFLDGYFLDGALLAPLPTLRSAQAIQLYLLHGQQFKNAESLFLNLVMPDGELRKYSWQRTIPELQQAYLERTRGRTRTKSAESEPKATMKRKKERATAS